MSQDDEEYNPYGHGDKQNPFTSKERGSLLGPCVISVHTLKVNGMCSIYLTNSTLYSTIMFFHHMTYTP